MTSSHCMCVYTRLVTAPPGGNMVAGRQTPLMKAAAKGYPEVVTLLLAYGADPWAMAGDEYR